MAKKINKKKKKTEKEGVLFTRHIPLKDLFVIETTEISGARLVFGYLGIFLMVIGILVLLPLVLLLFYPEEAHEYPAFVIPGVTSFVIGFILMLLIGGRKKGKLTSFEDVLMVISVWILAIAISAVPFFFYGYGFTQAFFESTSGYTSAGLTIMDWSKEVVTFGGKTDVASHMLFFHRALIELVGGIGLVLIVSSAISERSGLNLYLLEGHNDKLLPNLVKSARMIFTLYLGFIVFGTLMYIAVGVTPFDAVCHSMTAVATGGFSTKPNNINSLVMEVSMGGEWRGILVEIITEALMLLGGTNFVIHFNLFRRKFGVLKHFEYLVFFAILLVVWPFMILGFSEYFGGNVIAGLRYGTFEMISGLSTAGFQAVDSYQAHALISSVYAGDVSGIYNFTGISSALTPLEAAQGYASGQMIKFPSYLLLLLGVMMMIGMQNGSTTGAIKQNRIALAFMDIKWRIEAAINRPETYKVHSVYRFGKRERVDQAEISEAETFIGLYLMVIFIGTTLISVIASYTGLARGDGTGDPFSWLDCFFEFSSAVGTVGLGCGITSFKNSLTVGGQSILWIEMIGMMLGRLELFVYFIMFGKLIKRVKDRHYITKKIRTGKLS